MVELNDVFGSDYKEYQQKVDKLILELNEIELKYTDFFKDKKNRIDPEKPDRLHSHYVIANENGNKSFGFHKDSDLPQHIRQECTQAYVRVVGADWSK